MHPKHLSIKDFNYDLPAEKIAHHPLDERDSSKLLVYEEGEIKQDIYKNLAHHLPENSLLIFNNTKVIPARVLFKKPTGGTIEIFCLEPFGLNYSSAMNKKSSSAWKCMIGGAGKWKSGSLSKTISIAGEEVQLTVSLQQKLSDAYVAEFKWEPVHYSFAEIIEFAGEIPLPPYIKREAEANDKDRYQTIYAQHKGSVAAPTAGLHFTPGVFSSFEKKNIKTDFVTLHVGAGTFKPVKAEIMEAHEMHAEWIDVSLSCIENIANNLEGIVAVGTTSLRTIESLYWMGVKCYVNEDISIEELEIKQWEPYEELLSQDINNDIVLSSLVKWLKKNLNSRLLLRTHILIAPGYNFKIAKGLITNFHQPGSTLLLLVAAITDEWKKIYEYALNNDFRFLSYGDGCLIKIGQRNKE